MSFALNARAAAHPGGFALVAEGDALSGVLLDFTLPATTLKRIMLAVIIRDATIYPSQNTMGWQSVIDSSGASDLFLDAYARRSDGSPGSREGDIVSWLSLEAQELVGAVLEVGDTEIADVIASVNHGAFIADTTPSAPVVTALHESDVILVVAVSTTNVTWTPPTGFTEVEDYASTPDPSLSLGVFYRTAGEIGEIDPGSPTASASCTGRVWSVVLGYSPFQTDINAMTIEAIRDRMITLVTAATPTVLSDDKFRHVLDEGNGDFREWAEQNPQGAFRRFQVQDSGSDDGLPTYSAIDVEERNATMEVVIAYPHNARTGKQWNRDRKDAMDADWRKLYTILGPGMGQSNFSGANDCTLMNCSKSVEVGENCDYLVVTIQILYVLDVDA